MQDCHFNNMSPLYIVPCVNNRYGKPETSVSIHEYESHSLAYDRSKRIPVWVMEVLSNRNKERIANRRQSTFQVLLPFNAILILLLFPHS